MPLCWHQSEIPYYKLILGFKKLHLLSEIHWIVTNTTTEMRSFIVQRFSSKKKTVIFTLNNINSKIMFIVNFQNAGGFEFNQAFSDVIVLSVNWWKLIKYLHSFTLPIIHHIFSLNRIVAQIYTHYYKYNFFWNVEQQFIYIFVKCVYLCITWIIEYLFTNVLQHKGRPT